MNKAKSTPLPAPVTERRVLANKYDLEKALDGVVQEQSKRHWRTLCQELGERGIAVGDIMDQSLPSYAADVVALLEDGNEYVTLSELVVLGQYKKAIAEGDTKAATFLRDTAGYKPATEVSVEQRQDGLASMSNEELHQLLNAMQSMEDNRDTDKQ